MEGLQKLLRIFPYLLFNKFLWCFLLKMYPFFKLLRLFTLQADWLFTDTDREGKSGFIGLIENIFDICLCLCTLDHCCKKNQNLHSLNDKASKIQIMFMICKKTFIHDIPACPYKCHERNQRVWTNLTFNDLERSFEGHLENSLFLKV